MTSWYLQKLKKGSVYADKLEMEVLFVQVVKSYVCRMRYFSFVKFL